MKNWMVLFTVLGLTALTTTTKAGREPVYVLSAQKIQMDIGWGISNAPYQNLVPLQAPSDSTASFQRGKLVYKTYCLSCHQFDGGGVENLNPPIIKTPYVLGSKTRLIKIILQGFNEKVDIEGDSYSNNMPAIPSLTDEQIADVLTYVRNDFGNKAVSVKVADVHRVRTSIANK